MKKNIIVSIIILLLFTYTISAEVKDHPIITPIMSGIRDTHLKVYTRSNTISYNPNTYNIWLTLIPGNINAIATTIPADNCMIIYKGTVSTSNIPWGRADNNITMAPPISTYIMLTILIPFTLDFFTSNKETICFERVFTEEDRSKGISVRDYVKWMYMALPRAKGK